MVRAHEMMGYEVLDTLGYGARSTIYQVQDKKGQVYALKRVIRQTSHDDRFLEQAIREYRTARRMEHPALRRCFRLIRSRQVIRVTEVYVLMELVTGQTLEQNRPRDLIDLCYIFKEVAQGLQAMHDAGFVHADIKPNNIMVTDQGHVKIIDFGQSCKAGHVKERIQGTPDYIAPEQVKRKQITPATDIFNLGATLYWLLTNQHIPTLIPKGKVGVTLKTERKAMLPEEINPDVPPALSSLVMHCVLTNPEKRPPGMKHVQDRLDLSIAQLNRRLEDLEADERERAKRAADSKRTAV
jgi:eukaryotic-like serine/threonine-protein kinase